ncbi:hypothetical protein BDW74DRAFT_183596 [Aspergillus multicolor]|uniref:uncharacterized protein n=1 Tax=Aspergillus multicolor TaxID=41759 RepID=UPI003CCCDFFD
MSSYSTTIKAIIQGRQRQSSASGKALLVAIKDDDLPVAVKEVDAVERQFRLISLDMIRPGLWHQSPFLAYLSACSTGQNKHDNLLNESLHLINAFQLAGFQRVIGTLWAVEDKICEDMAVLTYQTMINEGMTSGAVCQGLHEATRQLRDRWLQKDIEVEAKRRRRRMAARNRAGLDVANGNEPARNLEVVNSEVDNDEDLKPLGKY